MISLHDAIEKMRMSGDWSSEEDTRWSEEDFVDFTKETGLEIPIQLGEVLIAYGSNGFGRPDKHANFVATFEDGSRSVHEAQVLVTTKEHMVSYHKMFLVEDDWPERFVNPMIFFGSADGGHSYLLMDGRNPNNNAVYFWERAADPVGAGDNVRGVGKVADTLYEFFYNLKPAEEL